MSEISLCGKNKTKCESDFCCVCLYASASTANMAKLEEMERLLREAQAEKRSLLEHKVPPKIQLKKKKIQLYMLILAVHRGIVFSCN